MKRWDARDKIEIRFRWRHLHFEYGRWCYAVAIPKWWEWEKP